MIRSAALGLAALGLAAPALAAEGGPIRGGEHAGFTRIVLTIEPATEWSLETVGGRATLSFPGRSLAFGTEGVFDKIPRTRVTGVTATKGAAGTTVTVELGCDCRVSTSFVGARYLALDIADRDAPAPVAEAVPAPDPAPSETPEARTAREAQAVAAAEQVLIRQIERAADQGLVRLQVPDVPPPNGPATAEAEEARPPPRRRRPPRRSRRRSPRWPRPRRRRRPRASASRSSTSRIRSTPPPSSTATAATRWRTAGRRSRPAACLPDARLDVAAWSNGFGLTAQVPALRRQLIGEFDAPNPQAVRDLARLYVRFGFGAEARAVLAAFAEAEVEDRALIGDLARIVEGGAAAPDGPLAVADACPGYHGLWLALGGAAPAFRDEAGFADAQAAFAALPPTSGRCSPPASSAGSSTPDARARRG